MSANVVRINDVADERLTPFRDIRERDLRRRDELFVAEGTVVLRMLAASDVFSAHAILVLENRLEGIRDIVAAFADDVPAYVVSREVIDAIAGFPMHRGVLALAKWTRKPTVAELLARSPRRLLVLCGLSNHDNVGGCFRAASAFGVDGVLLDQSCADPLYRKAIRVSAGAALIVPFAVGGGALDLLRSVRDVGIEVTALTPSATSTIEKLDRTQSRALVIGSEGEGLPASVLSEFPTARIRMAAGHDSLNAATCAAVALYALSDH